MLNYIWGGLIIFSFAFAMVSDIRDVAGDTYRNGQPLVLGIEVDSTRTVSVGRQAVLVTIADTTFEALYGAPAGAPLRYMGIVVQTEDGAQLRFARDADVPAPLGTIREMTSPRDNDLRGPLSNYTGFTQGVGVATAAVTFDPVRFVRLQAITAAALDFAETAVTLALSLIGALALWMGLLEIATRSKMLYAIVRFTRPVLGRLFPDIPRDHPALAMIALNLTANMLGLGNAATPLGLKAMEALQTLNPNPDTATDSMVMLLALNTASVQLVPPVLLVAIMGLGINQLMIGILIVTSISAVVAVVSARLLGRLPRYRAAALPVPASGAVPDAPPE